MKQTLYFSVLSAILLLASGCIFMPSVRGDGNVITQTIDIADYDEIEVQGTSIIFNYSQQESAPALSVTVDQNIYDLFEFKTDGEKLVIRPKERSKKQIRFRPTEFTITSNSSSLKKADMGGVKVFNLNGKFASNEKVKFSTAGSTTIELRDTVTVDQMEVSTAGQATLNANALYARVFKGEIAGKGTSNLKGAGEKADFEIAGSGKVHAFDYELSTLSCEIAGKGLIETFAKDQIDAEIAGMGTVKYKGNPSVKVDKAGLGSVKKVD